MNAYSHPGRRRIHPKGARQRGLWLLMLLLVCLLYPPPSFLRAQDTDGDNPTGQAGDYNGEVTTGGSYDPYTQNIKRAITDLVVPSSNGAYPLAFSRTYNSMASPAGNDTQYFGDGGNWRHSYMWTVSPGNAGAGSGNPGPWTVSYPDGATVTFRPNRPGAPDETNTGYWRGPSGTSDRLEMSGGVPTRLHLSDGGIVTFGGGMGGFHAAMITDPNGAVTKLEYTARTIESNGVTGQGYFLSKVTEPGGRWLTFTYSTVTYHGTYDSGGNTHDYTWTVLSQVQASTGQTVTYNYATFGNASHDENTDQNTAWTSPYYVLTGVNYDSEPSVSGSGQVQASYTYTDLGSPYLTTAHDPHYASAMVDIRYATNVPLEEQNLDGTRVSHLDGTPQQPGNNTSTETRGDKAAGGANITRTFVYNGGTYSSAQSQLYYNIYTRQFQSTPASEGTDAKNSQLTSYSDWEGHYTYLYYYPPGDPNGQGNLRMVTDALGNATSYGHEPYAGKVSAVCLPDGRTRYSTWRSQDHTDALHPYYLYQSQDERGQITTYQRDSSTGLVTEIDYPDGSNEQFQYAYFTPDNWATWYCKIYYQKTKLGAEIYYGYGANPNHASPDGSTPVADLLTSVTRHFNDGLGGDHWETTNFVYDAYDRLFLTTDPGGVATRTIYNARHQLVQTMHMADNTHVDRYYDDLGNCTDVSDEMGHTVHTVYDGYRRVLQVATPINDGSNGYRYQTFVYDPRDIYSNSLSSALSHTRSQWSVSWRTSTQGVERAFSPNGWLTCSYGGIIASGDWTQGPVTVSAGTGFVAAWATYSSVGQMLTSVDTQGQTSSFTYDGCGRKQTATDPNGHVTSWAYYSPSDTPNYQGWLKSVTVPGPDINANNGTVTTTYTGYDKMGRVQATVDPFNHTFQSGYDAAGNLIAQTDGLQTAGTLPSGTPNPGQHDTLYGYDQLGRKVWVANPADSNKKETWTYDTSGNVHQYKNFAGNTCTYTYDGRNRCTGYTWDDGATSPTTYGYDAASRLTDVNNWHANIHYTYDDAGEVLTEQITHNDTGAGGTTSYTRDADGNTTAISYPSGFCPSFAYDTQQRCTGVYSGNYTFSNYTFYGNWLTGRALHNGLCTTFGYQANGRCSDVWHRHGDLNCQNLGLNVSRHLYGFEPDGQISWFDREADNGESGSVLETGQGDAFRYDPDGSLNLVYRNVHYNGGGGGPYGRNNWPSGGDAHGDSQMNITAWDGTGANATDTYLDAYSYDAAGNRSQNSWVYRNATQPGYSVQGDNKYDYSSYDLNNNTTDSCVGWQYAYDAENHLTHATGPGGQSATFYYDGLGRLCRQQVGDAFKRFYYVGSQRGEERDHDNNPLQNYMYDAPGSDRILYRQGQYGGFYYQYDLMGNTSHVSDGNGNVVEQYLYDAYGQPSVYDGAGNARPGGSAIDNRYLFKGAGAYEWIAPMATYYCRARFYLPFHGRWLQPDPIGQAGGLNIYTYCGNDPVNGADPSGLAEPNGTGIRTQTIDGHIFPAPDGGSNIPSHEEVGAAPVDQVDPSPTSPKPANGGSGGGASEVPPNLISPNESGGSGGGVPEKGGNVVPDNTLWGGISDSLFDVVSPVVHAFKDPVGYLRDSLRMASGAGQADAFVAIAGDPRATCAAVQRFAADAAANPYHTTGYVAGSVSMALIPGAEEQNAFRILEESNGVIHIMAATSKGTVEIMANVAQEGEILSLTKVHIEGIGGTGAGALGRVGLNELKKQGALFGASRGARQVLVQGAMRTSGKYKGRIPAPLLIETGL